MMTRPHGVVVLLALALAGCAGHHQEGEQEHVQTENAGRDDAFWHIVEQVRARAADPEERPEELERHLETLSAPDIEAFDRTYHEQLARAYRWDLWGAAYVIGGGCSDDGFRYFRDYLISEGREVFEAALRDPESLASLEIPEDVDLESYGYAASAAYETVSGQDLPFPDVPSSSEPAGTAWDEDDLGALFPRLAAKYDWDT